MRISDWSSACALPICALKHDDMADVLAMGVSHWVEYLNADAKKAEEDRKKKADAAWEAKMFRSEEHTSELQSLMRISYAVFCLKKNNKNTHNHHNHNQKLQLLKSIHKLNQWRQGIQLSHIYQ